MKIILLIIIVPAIFVYTADAQYFSISPSSKSIDITFDSPKGDKGWSNPYLRDFEISITNQLNTTLTVSVSPSSYDSSYIRLISSTSSLNIPALSSGSVKITVQIVDSASDGGSYSGRVKLSSNSQSEYVNVYVKTIYPPPTLSFSGNLDFGEVAAGQSYSRSFTLKELLKFKNANNVKVELNAAGPIYDAVASPSMFSYIDYSGRTITFSFKVRERNIEPNTYASTVSVSSTNSAYLIDSRLRYAIPRPIVEVSQPEGEIFFEYGKIENRNQMLVISEKGGKTPLEYTGISYKKLNREIGGEKKEYKGANWFNFPAQVDYIAPANSKNIDINVNPADAPVGRYTWEGDVKTKYAGEKPFSFYFVVKPPGLEEIKDKLTKLRSDPLVIKYPQAENLRQTTESLLIKDEKGMADISNVISLSNVVIMLLNSMSAAHAQHERKSYNEAYEEFRASKEERDELNRIKLIEKYSQESSSIKNSANNVWKEVALNLMNGFEQYANLLKDLSYTDADYAKAKEVHIKIGDICTWLNDNSCVEMQNNRVRELNKKIEDLMLEAGDLENKIGEIHEDIYYNTWSFLGTELVKNPSKFAYFMEKYVEMTENYVHISRNYKLSGAQKELEKTQDRETALKKEYESFKLANSVYLIFLGLILVLTTRKSIQGFIKYRADAKDVKLAEIARMKRII